jgi:hypothetical protein
MSLLGAMCYVHGGSEIVGHISDLDQYHVPELTSSEVGASLSVSFEPRIPPL